MPPNGVELGDDEFILHVEGTASSQRVVRHIGATSWPGLSHNFLLLVTNWNVIIFNYVHDYCLKLPQGCLSR